MQKPMRSWGRPSPSDLPSAGGKVPAAVRSTASSVEPSPPNAGVTPVAKMGSSAPPPGATGMGQEVLVSLARAPLGSRVFLESRPTAGPAERIQAIALPTQGGGQTREFRAVLPPSLPGSDQVYLPVAVVNGREVRGESFRRTNYATEQRSARVFSVPEASVASSTGEPAETSLPFPAMTLIAHVDAELPKATVFGATPDGLRIAFYIADGHWRGPRINGRYKAEGGDWLLVRKDGVAIPNVRATLETSDGALLYYELSGTIDLGPEGYARSLAGELPDATPFSAVARLSTASENWKWMNRLTLVGAGVVNLKIRRAHYDLYSIQCAPEAVTP